MVSRPSESAMNCRCGFITTVVVWDSTNHQPMKIAVVCGGKSTEHDVSIRSARSILESLDQQKHTVIPVVLTRDNQVVTYEDSHEEGAIAEAGFDVLNQLAERPSEQDTVSLSALFNLQVDVVINIIHGNYGEDGKLAAFFELMEVPYVGSGVLASSLAMDKHVTKQLVEHVGVNVVPFEVVYKDEEYKDVMKKVDSLGYPLFVKPANNGSSIGITKCDGADSFEEALHDAFLYDHKVLLEQAITDMRELEVAVMGSHRDPEVASSIAEIAPDRAFYDYDAKYDQGSVSEVVIPALIEAPLAARIRDAAMRIYQALHCDELARVDFFYHPSTDTLYLNEVNTLPGFTSISAYAKMWEADGVSYADLLERLMTFAVSRHKRRSSLKQEVIS